MFTEDGEMTSCAKSQIVPCLEGLTESEKVLSIPNCDAIIYDGHACIQIMDVPQMSGAVMFEDMARQFFDFILNKSKHSNDGSSVTQLHVVFDRYLQGSIKGQTRQKCIAGCQGNIHHVRPDIRIQTNWKQFLGNEENKTNLAEYYCSFMCDNNAVLTEGQTLMISGRQDDKMVHVDAIAVTNVPALRSNQEETDTRIIMHTVESARKGAETIVVSSPDTDVLILLLHHRIQIGADRIFFLTGRTGKHASLTRYIPVHGIHSQLTSPQRQLLLPVYCLTGCDTTSSFFGHGKKSAFRILRQGAEIYNDLATLGTTTELTKAQFVQCMKFVGSFRIRIVYW